MGAHTAAHGVGNAAQPAMARQVDPRMRTRAHAHAAPALCLLTRPVAAPLRLHATPLELPAGLGTLLLTLPGFSGEAERADRQGRRRAMEPRLTARRGAARVASVQSALRAALLPRGGPTGTVGGPQACGVRVQPLGPCAGGGSEQRAVWRMSAHVSCAVPANMCPSVWSAVYRCREFKSLLMFLGLYHI